MKRKRDPAIGGLGGAARQAPHPPGVRVEPLSHQDQAGWAHPLFEQRQRGSGRETRIVVDLPARCLAAGRASRLPGYVQNLGVGGLLPRLPELLPVETKVTLTIRSPLQALQLAGRIAWGQARPDERHALGVALTDHLAG